MYPKGKMVKVTESQMIMIKKHINESVEVENDKLYCSSYEGGIIGWDDEKETYYHARYQHRTELDILGFIDIVVEKDNDERD